MSAVPDMPSFMSQVVPTLPISVVLTVAFALLLFGTIYRTLSYGIYGYLIVFTLAKTVAYALRCVNVDHASLGSVIAYNVFALFGFFAAIALIKNLLIHWHMRIHGQTERTARVARISRAVHLLLVAISAMGIYAASAAFSTDTTSLRQASAWLFFAVLVVAGIVSFRLYSLEGLVHKSQSFEKSGFTNGKHGIRFLICGIPTFLFCIKSFIRALNVAGVNPSVMNQEWFSVVFDPVLEILACAILIGFNARHHFKPDVVDDNATA
ncbi:hypothetical protein GQ42DRAFT_163391 [Ramicandelaber brevisporus]|nr:hypothetical protein GQ42DRAFT_163391 [Ramicandelaber brevisporus]